MDWKPASEIIFDTHLMFLLEHADEQAIVTGFARKAGDFWDLETDKGIAFSRNYWGCKKWRHYEKTTS